MQQKRLTLIIGVVLALLAVFMVKIYLDQQRRVLREQAQMQINQERANQTPVLVAKEDIPKGTVLEPDMLTTAIVPNQYVQSQAVTSLDRIAGMITAVPIPKEDQITLTKLISNQQAGASSLAMATPVGKRAISISVDNISSLAGMLSPGDYVDVIGLLPIPVQTEGQQQSAQLATIPLFQNVLILAVGQELRGARAEAGAGGRYKKEEAPREPSPVITLALVPQEANIITFVQEQGKIRLVLRSPADSQTESVTPASWDSIFQYIMPKQPPAPEQSAAVEIPKPKKEVEIYRGMQKEIVPLSR